MGFPLQVIKALCLEAAFRREKAMPVRRIALFGRQTVHASIEELSSLLNLSVPNCSADITRHSVYYGENHISDIDLLQTIFPGADIDVFDRSDYEGANRIVDLNLPIPPEYHSLYDLVYTGGCLDNIFNPFQVLINSSMLLEHSGTVIHYESAAGLIGAYLYYTPEWFYSYYSVNCFADIHCFLLNHIQPSSHRFKYLTESYRYQPRFTRSTDFDYLESSFSNKGIFYNLVIAQRCPSSTIYSIPVQLQYLDNKSVDWTTNDSLFTSSLRLDLFKKYSSFQANHPRTLPYKSDHYAYIGSAF
jgi:hypothetical protein